MLSFLLSSVLSCLMLLQGQAAAKVLSPAEMAEYEEKKLKMRKAMGENLHDDVQGKPAFDLGQEVLCRGRAQCC